jgi:hypothetical protein
MPVESGHPFKRSDTKHFAKCGTKSLMYCRTYGYNCADHECEFGIVDKRRKANKKKLFLNINNENNLETQKGS